MDALFNEFCLNEGHDFLDILVYLVNTVESFENSNIRLSTDLNAFNNWLSDWRELIPVQQQTRFYSLIRRLYPVSPSSSQHYYHYYNQHQLSITNYSGSTLATAADKVLAGHNIVVINLPNSAFCARPHIPILKAPFDLSARDQLAIVPSWGDSRRAMATMLVSSKMRSLLKNDEEFDDFTEQYKVFLEQFDVNKWEPKTYEAANKLDSYNAFPASSHPKLQQYFHDLRRHANGSVQENIITYKTIGGLVLRLNGYEFNAALSQHYQSYHIYEGGLGGNKLLVSIDNENGAFEVLESDGTHIGVYGYDGKYKKHYTELKDIQSHSLKNVPTQMLKYSL